MFNLRWLSWVCVCVVHGVQVVRRLDRGRDEHTLAHKSDNKIVRVRRQITYCVEKSMTYAIVHALLFNSKFFKWHVYFYCDCQYGMHHTHTLGQWAISVWKLNYIHYPLLEVRYFNALTQKWTKLSLSTSHSLCIQITNRCGQAMIEQEARYQTTTTTSHNWLTTVQWKLSTWHYTLHRMDMCEYCDSFRIHVLWIKN